jgi:signal-transduction protein with cAMP-binding, CBS, and nucleotidyltransferase domain
MKLHDVMHPPVTISQLADIPTAARAMRDHNVGCLIVTSLEEPIGMITDRDLTVRCTAAGHEPFACKVLDHMTTPLVMAARETDALEAVHVMVHNEVKRLPVMEGSKIVGVVSMSDIAEALEMPLQELLAGMGGARHTTAPTPTVR